MGGGASAARRPEVNRTTIGRGALWSVASMGAGQGLALLTFLVTARYVSRESFGVMAVTLASVEFLKRVWIEPFSLSVAASVDTREADYDACFVLTTAATALLVVLVLAAAEVAAAAGAGADVVLGLRLIAALSLTIGLWRTHETWLVRHMQFRTLAMRSIVAASLGGATGVAMAVHGFDLWSLVGQQVVTGATSLLLLWTTTPWRPRWRVDGAALRLNASRARHLVLSAAGVFLASEADIFVASGVLGIEAAALYNAAKRIMLALHLFLTNSTQAVMVPTFANLPGPAERRAAGLRAVGVVASITVPAALGLMSLSEPLVSVVLGAKWIASAPVLSALAIGLATTALMQFNTAVFMVNGRYAAVTRYAVLSALANAALLPGAALLGSTALALGAAGVQLLVFPFATRSALRASGISVSDYADRIGKPLLAALVMAALLDVSRKVVPLTGAASLAVLVPAGAAAYFAVLACISPPAVREMAGLARSVLRRRRAALG